MMTHLEYAAMTTLLVMSLSGLVVSSVLLLLGLWDLLKGK